MPFKYAILGAGRQGVALAYDLAKNCEAGSIVLADVDPGVAQSAVARLGSILPYSKCEFRPVTCDLSRQADVGKTIEDVDVVISAAPYRYNLDLTDAAIKAGASFCDLGGNTGIVREQLKRDAIALLAGVSIVPDCGLAPGLGNHLAAHGISQLERPEHVHIRCGGLPEQPVGPLGYKLVFNFWGLLNEYSGFGEFLRDGRKVEAPSLSELEQIEFPPPVGMCEAAVTSGGTSTCPDTFLGKLLSYDYKTVRYPGHFAIIKAMFELGCFAELVILSDGERVHPRPVLQKLMEDRLKFPDVDDVVVMRVTVEGKSDGKPKKLQYDLFDRQDKATGFSAMERTTAFPAALVAYMQARKIILPGAKPLEVSVPAQQYFDELPSHDIQVDLSF